MNLLPTMSRFPFRRGLFILFCLLPTLSSAKGAPKKTLESFRGEVGDGKAFEKKLHSGLLFQLRPVDGGYEIWLTSASKSEHNYCGAVTPPFHGPNPLYINSYDFEPGAAAKKKNQFGNERRFGCVAGESDYREANDALQRILWPPKDETKADAKKARSDYDRQERKALQGRLEIQDIRTRRPIAGVVEVESMRFEFQLW